jgi:hypothetical protein
MLAAAAPATRGQPVHHHTKARDRPSIIDTDSLEVVGNIHRARASPIGSCSIRTARRPGSSATRSHDLGVIDAESRKLVKRVKIGGNPYNLAFQPRTARHLLVLDWGSDTSNDEIIFYDLKAEKIDGRVAVSTGPRTPSSPATASSSTSRAKTAGDVTVVDVAQRTVVGRVSTAAVTRWAWPSRGTASYSMRPPARTR